MNVFMHPAFLSDVQALTRKPKTMRNYELTSETMSHNGRTLYRIRATRDFFINSVTLIKAGTLGGWVEGYRNLQGDAWVADEAKVYDDACVFGHALIAGCAEIFEWAKVFGWAKIYDSVKIFGHAQIYGQAFICHGVEVSGQVEVSGSASIIQGVKISGTTRLSGRTLLGQFWDGSKMVDSYTSW